MYLDSNQDDLVLCLNGLKRQPALFANIAKNHKFFEQKCGEKFNS